MAKDAVPESSKPQNQCDGCALGLPVNENGVHYRVDASTAWERLHVSCTKDKYDPIPAKLPDAAPDEDNELLREGIAWWKQGAPNEPGGFTEEGMKKFVNALIEVAESKLAAAQPDDKCACGHLKRDHFGNAEWCGVEFDAGEGNRVLCGCKQYCPADGWIAVTPETMPPVGKNVAILVEDADVYIHGWVTAGYLHSPESGWWHGTPGDYRSCSDQRWTVTHWCPLPTPPVQEKSHDE